LAVPERGLLAEQSGVKPESVPAEEYAIYDRVVQEKFLTSQTKLVLIAGWTVTRLGPEWPPTDQALFDESSFFEGRLPPDLVRDFITKNRRPSRLEGRFNFGVRYRFASGQAEEPEVSLAPIPAAGPFTNLQSALALSAGPTLSAGLTLSAGPTIGILGFSRTGFTRRADQALVYVGDDREDGTGAGFLLWLYKRGQVWEIADTEVLWIAQPE
jgi:hypothetical protein